MDHFKVMLWSSYEFFFKFSAFQSVNEVLPISYTCMCVYKYIYIYIYIYKTCTTYVTGGAHDFLSYY